MQEFDPIDVEFVINSEEVKRKSAEVRKEIEGVGLTAESATATVKKTISGGLTQQADALGNMYGTVKRTAEDAVEAFEQIDPAIRRQIQGVIAFENQLGKLGMAEKQLQKDLKGGIITQGQYNKTLAAIRAESARAQMGLSNLSKEVRSSQNVMSQAGAVSVRSWNGLQNSINQISRELPAFTYSAQTGFMAISNNIPILADEIGRLRVENQKLTASGQQATPIWKQLVSGLFSWQTLLSVGVTLLTVYGKEIGNWIIGLIRVKEETENLITAQEALNKAYGSTDVQKAVESVFSLRTNLDLAKQGLIDQKTVIEEYNESIGKAAGEVRTLGEVEAGLVDNSDKFIQATIYKAAAMEVQQEIAKEMAEALKEQNRIEQDIIKESEKLAKMSGFNSNTMPGMPFSETQIQKATISDLQKAQAENNKLQQDISTSGGKIISQLRDMSLATGLNLFNNNKVAKEGKTVLDEREKLLLKILELDNEYARKSLTKDEEEVQALRDKFAKVRKLVDDYNNDPKNRARRIDVSGIGEMEEGAVGDLRYRQETNSLKSNLEEQKRLYDQYNAAVTSLGLEEANRRYASELDIARTYLSTLQDEYNKLSTIPEADLSGPQRERMAVLAEEMVKETAAQQKQLDDLLASLQSYNDKRGLIEEEYQRKRRDLEQSGNTGYLAELERQYSADVAQLDEAHIKKMEVFQRFFAGVEDMSTKNARQLIRDVRETVAVLREEYPELGSFFDDIESRLGETELKLSGRISTAVAELGQGFRRVGQSIKNVNSDLAVMLRTLGDSLARVSEVQRGMDAFNLAQSKGDTFGAVTAGAGVAGAVLGGVIQLINVLKSANEKQAAILQKQLDFQRQIYYGELAVNKLLRDRALEQAEIEGRTLDNLLSQRNTLKTNYEQLQIDIANINQKFSKDISNATLEQLSSYDINGWYSSQKDKLIAKLGESLYVDGTKTVSGGFLGLGKKEVDIFKSLAGMDFDAIEDLSIKGQLTAQAEEAFQKLKQLKEEGVQVEEQLAAIEKELKDIFIGGATASGLADTIIEGFRQGKRAVEEFGDDVEAVLQNAILSGFKFRFLEAPLNDLLEQLYQDSQTDAGIDSSAIDRFTQEYNNITAGAIAALEQIERGTGMSLTNPGNTSPQGLSGAIRRELTEATGSELAGLYRAQYDLSKRQLVIVEQHLSIGKQHYEATVQVLRHQAAIASNTAAAVDALTSAVVELRGINKNTKPFNNSRPYDG